MDNKIQNFYDLDAWRKAHELTIEIYGITKKFPRDELYGIVSQLRRATSSIAANTAEGFARYHFKDKIRFYHQARGSSAEVQNFLLLTKNLEYIDPEIYKSLNEKSKKVMQLINGLIRSIKNQK